jgi:hypothetical protein
MGEYYVVNGLVGFMSPGGGCAGVRCLKLEDGGFETEVKSQNMIYNNNVGKIMWIFVDYLNWRTEKSDASPTHPTY